MSNNDNLGDDPLQRLQAFILLVLAKISLLFENIIVVIFVAFLLILGILFLIFKSLGLT